MPDPGVYQVIVRASDGVLTEDQLVTVTVTPANDPPTDLVLSPHADALAGAEGTWTYLGNANGLAGAGITTITPSGVLVGTNVFAAGDLVEVSIAWRGNQTVTPPANWNLLGMTNAGDSTSSSSHVSVGTWWAEWRAGLSFQFTFSSAVNVAIARTRGYRNSLGESAILSVVDSEVVPSIIAQNISTAAGLSGSNGNLIIAAVGAAYGANSHFESIGATNANFSHSGSELGSPSGADVWVGTVSGTITDDTGPITVEFLDVANRGHAMVAGTFRGTLSPYVFGLTVRDDTPVGMNLFTITGVDPENDPLTFTELLDPDGKFTLTGNVISLAAALDADLDTVHPITIRATDTFGNTYDETFNILVVAAWLQVSQHFVDVIYSKDPPQLRPTQHFVDVVYTTTPPDLRVTQHFIDVIYKV